MLWFRSDSKRIEALAERLETLEHDFKEMRLDWNTVYDKVVKAMNRTIRSRAIIESREQQEEEAAATPAPSGRGNGSGRLLTPRQMNLQQEILRRRAGG